ncbi:SDR family NAD(P)-dependent oxidoreductase [Silvanigrella aquatica]|uniref:Oxidoreductase n=1 Tax=Silvanigrella aquatica TaxID=1915309 RepID=A0A1L4D247_9BACT|nr:SDR family oxidoreductase [Silvanigrella aquatica]APJ04268.1 oxidoreductase [Silvanigrella aquatica]
MDLKLIGKKALITGSTSGIGYAIAQSLLNEGAAIVINGRTQERVDQAIEKLSKLNPHSQKIYGIAADVGTKTGVEKLCHEINEVDILVNNFGIYSAKPFDEISDEDWIEFINYNVMSGIRLSRYYLSKMKAKNWGRIVFISSESGVHIPSEMIHYGVTKTAQIALSRGLAETTSGTGVTVNSVLPGPTWSEGVEKFMSELAKQTQKTNSELEKSFFKEHRASSLIKRFASVEEVANMVTYVCSPLSSATNGAALRVEGGLLRGIV